MSIAGLDAHGDWYRAIRWLCLATDTYCKSTMLNAIWGLRLCNVEGVAVSYLSEKRIRVTEATGPVSASRPIPARGRSEVWWLALVMLVGFFIAVVTHYVMGFYLGRPYPYNTFLFDPIHPFNDLAVTLRVAGNPSPYLGASANRPSS